MVAKLIFMIKFIAMTLLMSDSQKLPLDKFRPPLPPRIWGGNPYNQRDLTNPFYKRPFDYFDQIYNQKMDVLERGQTERKTLYKKYLNQKRAVDTFNILNKQNKELDQSSPYYQTMRDLKTNQRREAKLKEEILKIQKYRNERRSRDISRAPDFDFRPENMRSYYDYYWGLLKLRKYYIQVFNWSDIKRYGLTILEMQKIILCISILRFLFYALRYNARIGFTISISNFIASILYINILRRGLSACIHIIYQQPILFRLGFERFNAINDTYYQLLNSRKFISSYTLKDVTLFDYYPYWLGKIIYNNDMLYNFQTYFDRNILPNILLFWSQTARRYVKFTIFSYFLKFGRDYLPYFVRYHAAICVFVSQALLVPWGLAMQRTLQFLHDTLIPELRVDEILLLEAVQSAMMIIFVYLIILAVLHALFSQYYYVPFLSQALAANIGIKDNDKIIDGGYASWQDEQNLWKASKADFKIWFGFLGKAKNTKKSKIRKLNEKLAKKLDAETNFLFLFAAILFFSIVSRQIIPNTQNIFSRTMYEQYHRPKSDFHI